VARLKEIADAYTVLVDKQLGKQGLGTTKEMGR
jgi:hypothetical protein